MQALFVIVACAAVGAVAGSVTTVHVVAHTHDDVGWLKTVDEYYLGANQSIQEAGVQYVLDSVVPQLEADPRKRFSYVAKEIAFFERWWREQNAAMQARVKKLVAEGRFEFINGGWCMNDEAGVSDEGIITQMTLGHMFLKKTFGVTPTVGWQIDPFGHSNTMASLFSQMGFSSVFFARIDYQDYQHRKNNVELEFLWRPSASLGNASDIFAHAMWDQTYCYPGGFDFENDAPPVNTDDRLEGVGSVAQRAREFAQEMRGRMHYYQAGHQDLLVTYGCDFAFANANVNFKNMDKLMDYINSRPDTFGLNVIYSTPSIYAAALNKKQLSWPLKNDDIFPYADRPYAYWTGYLTSRPALKGYVRSRNALLHASDKMFATFGISDDVSSLLTASSNLRAACSVAQHHDAVAGTEQQHVAYDYAKQLATGSVAVQQAASPVVASMTGTASEFSFCEYLNETECPPITGALAAGHSVPLVLYNSLAWDRVEAVTVPATSGTRVLGTVSQLSTDPFSKRITVTFIASVPAQGWNSYALSSSSSPAKLRMTPVRKAAIGDSISNKFYNLTFGGSDGSLSSVNGYPFQMDYLWYNASDGNNANSSQASGAYIFRPNSTTPFRTSGGSPLSVRIEKGSVFEAAYLVYNPWVQVAVRLYATLPYIEIVSKIGPIDVSDGLGKEIVHRFDTPIASGAKWYTDSSWEEMMERRRDFRPTWNLNVTNPVAGNYVPLNMAAFVRDANTQLSVVSDRSHGCASLASGQLESMLHRRLLHDDGRGVGEPLDESEAVIARQWVTLAAPSPSFRVLGLRLNHPLQVAIGQGGVKIAANSTSGLHRPFSPLVHLMDYFLLDNQTALVRLRHVYAVGEGASVSQPVSLNLSDHITRPIASVSETQVTGVQPPSFVDDRMHWKAENEPRLSRRAHRMAARDSGVITLNPMQIRTFVVSFAQ